MSNHSSTKAFFSWLCVAPAIVFVGAISLALMDVGDGVGYLFPYIAIIIVAVLGVSALVTGFSNRTTFASLLGTLTGLVLAAMLGASIL
jgi:hypothetical protein